jgi:hypothetical protein
MGWGIGLLQHIYRHRITEAQNEGGHASMPRVKVEPTIPREVWRRIIKFVWCPCLLHVIDYRTLVFNCWERWTCRATP